MTRSSNGETVDLSIGSWIKLVLAASGFVGAQWLGFSARMNEVEKSQAVLVSAANNREQRLQALELRLERQRDEWLGQITALRQELRQK